MNIFNKKKAEDYTVIIGCGRLGANIADELSNDGKNVLIIDENQSAFRRLSSNFGGLSIVGNGTDFDVLKEAKLGKANVAIVVTNNDNTNIMIAQIAKEVFNVKNVIARLYDPTREDIYQGLGINTICPAMLSIKEINNMVDGAYAQEA